MFDVRLDEILMKAVDMGSSDVHITAGRPVTFRIDGELRTVYDEKVTPDDVARLANVLIAGETKIREEIDAEGEVDFAYSVEGYGRFRVNLFKQRNSYTIVMRLLPYDIPRPEALGVPQSVVELSDLMRGLVLVTGATGSGKSTTLASLIMEINKKYNKHIITLEDPIEYLHRHQKSIVNQRELGTDTSSYAHALRAALRQDPDVILVGEMRDLETISTAITAAETGHLVFSTLHTNNAAATIDRVIDVFPPHQQQQIRVQLANVLEGVIAQQLLPMEGHGRVAAFEVMLTNPAIRNLIREGKAYQITNQIQTGKKQGMQTMDDAILEIYMTGKISKEVAIHYAIDQEGMAKTLELY